MEPQSSLPYSQAPAPCPDPEPTPSSPHNPFPLPLLSSHLRLGLPNGLLPSGFPSKTLCILHVPKGDIEKFVAKLIKRSYQSGLCVQRTMEALSCNLSVMGWFQHLCSSIMCSQFIFQNKFHIVFMQLLYNICFGARMFIFLFINICYCNLTWLSTVHSMS